MAAVRHLGIVLPPYETTHEVSVAVGAVKFHVNLIDRSAVIVACSWMWSAVIVIAAI